MDFEPQALTIQRSRGGPVARAFRRFRQTETGQALVEFTMILPIFLMLLFGLVDFGRGFYTWLLVTNAAREGARIAAVQSDSDVINARIYDSFCNNYPSSCGLDPSKLTITTTNVQGEQGTAVEIDLEYAFEFATPLGEIMQVVSGGKITAPKITAHSSMRLE